MKPVLSVTNVLPLILHQHLVVSARSHQSLILQHVHDANQDITRWRLDLFNVNFVHEVSIVHKRIWLHLLAPMELSVIINKHNAQHVHQATTHQ